MSETIVKKIPVDDMMQFTKIVTKAYPGWQLNTKEMLEKVNERNIYLQENYDYSDFYGAYRHNKLLAGMRTYDFKMNWQQTNEMKVAGVGLVAVDLLHKKEKLAKELITNFISNSKEKGINLVALYPFRPDFYKKMGFGYGSKKSTYRFKPSALPSVNNSGEISYLTEEDAEEMLTCYNRFAKLNHGMFYRNIEEIKQFFKNEKI